MGIAFEKNLLQENKMKVILRTEPDRTLPETKFKEEEIPLTGGILTQISSLLTLANNEFQRHAENDKRTKEKKQWGWWRVICQTTWAEGKFFPIDGVDKSFDLRLSLNFLRHKKNIHELGLSFELAYRVGRSGENVFAIDIWCEPQQEFWIAWRPNYYHQLFAVEPLLLRLGHWLSAVHEQDMKHCISLLLASFETQVRKVSEGFATQEVSG